MTTFSSRPVYPAQPPFGKVAGSDKSQPWAEPPHWPCSWVRLKDLPEQPFVIGYRLRFHLPIGRNFRVHLSADQRYEFFVDGERVGRGPTRAPRGRWHYQSYELELPAGEHTFSARVHSLGALAPWAQTTFGHGWLLAPEPNDLWLQLGTGHAAWEAKVLTGYKFHSPGEQTGSLMGVGPVIDVHGDDYCWEWQSDSVGWSQVETTYAGNNGVTLYFKPDQPLLHPSPIAPMKAEAHYYAVLRTMWMGDAETSFPLSFDEGASAPEEQRWLGLLKGERITIAPFHKVRALLDFEDYLTAYPLLTITGGKGAVVRLGWSEALFDETGKKGDRNLIAGRYWRGMGDSFWPDGGDFRPFEPLWWRCGRYLLLEVETGEQTLQLERLSLEKTGYPLSVSAQWQCSDKTWPPLFTMCVRTLQACMHETYMDCPYYEQLQYLGDTRLQILLTYVLSGDDRLACQALTAFAAALRNPSGWMPSNHPSQVGQCIPPFALWWVSMLYDFGRWRGDRVFVKTLLPAARQVVETWLGNWQAGSLVASPEGWNFVDWVDHLGDAQGEFHGTLNWQMAYTLRQLSELEEWCGEPELAARMHRFGESVALACERFWSQERELYADDIDRTLFSEHTNCLALLSGVMVPERRVQCEQSLYEAQHVSRCSVYFAHYLFEAAATSNRPDVIEKRLAPWFDLAGQGFVTTPETFAKARSDCHAWGAHPLYHYFASVLGIRPLSWGFESVEIAPQLGSLPWAKGKMPHPRGEIEVEFRHIDDELHGHIILPEGVNGIFRCGDFRTPLQAGKQEIRVRRKL